MSTMLPLQRQVDRPPVHASAAPGLPGQPAYTALLASLVAVAAGYGLLVENAYRSVPGLLEQTWRAQDAVTLLALPIFIQASRRAGAGSLPAHLVSVGVLTWLSYAYAHLAIGAPFTVMFLVYVTIVALAAFAMLDGLLRIDVTAVAPAFSRAPRRAAMWFLAASRVMGPAGDQAGAVSRRVVSWLSVCWRAQAITRAPATAEPSMPAARSTTVST